MKNRSAHKNDPTAAEAYAANRHDVARLMDVLQMELDSHAEKVKASPGDRGLAGDLAKVRGDLINAIGFLSRKGTEEIEAFLNDAEDEPHNPTTT